VSRATLWALHSSHVPSLAPKSFSSIDLRRHSSCAVCPPHTPTTQHISGYHRLKVLPIYGIRDRVVLCLPGAAAS
jgi:hypothetical protein